MIDSKSPAASIDIASRFQNTRFLQSAPYFDFADFIKALKENLLGAIERKRWINHSPDFVDDIRSYCEGKLLYLPLAPSTRQMIGTTFFDKFPEADGDRFRNVAISLIVQYICTPIEWRQGHRGQNISIDNSIAWISTKSS